MPTALDSPKSNLSIKTKRIFNKQMITGDNRIACVPVDTDKWLALDYDTWNGEVFVSLRSCRADGNDLIPVGHPIRVAIDRLDEMRRALHQAEQQARRWGLGKAKKKEQRRRQRTSPNPVKRAVTAPKVDPRSGAMPAPAIGGNPA